MDDDIWLDCLDCVGEGLRVADVGADVVGEFGAQVGALEQGSGFGVQGVAGDLVAVVQEPGGEPGAFEAGVAGDQVVHDGPAMSSVMLSAT